MNFFKTMLVIFCLSLTGSISTAQKRQKSTEQVAATEKSDAATFYHGLALRSIGPAITSGRIADFAVRPDKPNEYYVATASGGVWKTSNAGTTWTPLFDKQGSYSIGCIALDPQNPHVVWVGTGENNNQRSVAYGDGVYRSMDGGEHWKNMGLENSEHISRIIVDPNNSSIVYVAAYGPLWSEGGDRGIYKSVDGGLNWERVLYISEHTGFSDLVMDPFNSEVLYAAAHQRRRHVFTYVGGGPESAMYKSTDGGLSWQKLTVGLPKSDIGRIGLAISDVNSDYVYAIIEAAGGEGGFFRSVNRGASWTRMSKYSTSGNYYQEIVCDPTRLDRVYAMDTWLHFTDDGGKTFNKMNEQLKHVDNHAMWVNPDDTDHYIVGCDGGIYVSYDGAVTWRFVNNLPVTQFYKAAADNAQPFYFVYGGTQDNFTLGGPSRTIRQNGIANSDWFVTTDGDGFKPLVDPKDPDVVYSQAQYGALYRFEKTSGERIEIRPVEHADEAPYRWNWDAPIIISPHSHTRLYFAANKVFRSDDRGDHWEVVSPDLTRNIDRNNLKVMGKVWSIDAVEKNGSTSVYGNIVALAESPLQEGLIYAGTDDGLIQITENGGSDWRAISKFASVPEFTYVNSIVASRHDAATAYAVFNNHKNGDFRPYLLKSTDRGRTWSEIQSNLPKRGSIYAIAEDHKDPHLLFAGTEFGLFFTYDGGERWVQLNKGLPTIAVRDLVIQEEENDLILATFGRGFYILDNYSPLRELTDALSSGASYLFSVKDALAFMEVPSLGYPGRSFQGNGFYCADNPTFGATFTYYLKDSIPTLQQKRKNLEEQVDKTGGDISYPSFDAIREEHLEQKPLLVFTITDQAGNVVRRLTAKTDQGIGRITWDLRYGSHAPVEDGAGTAEKIPWKFDETGPMALPGAYQVEMAALVNGNYHPLAGPREFNVVSLGLNKLRSQDQVALSDFQKEAAQLRMEVLGTSRYIDEMERALRLMRKAVWDTPGLDKVFIEKIDVVERRLAALKIDLQGDVSLRKHNFATKPSISERVDNIVMGIWSSTSPPTGTMKESLRIASTLFKSLLEQVRSISKQEMAALDKELEAAHAPYTPGRLPASREE